MKSKITLLVLSVLSLSACSEEGGYCETTVKTEIEYGEFVFKNDKTVCYDLDGNVKEADE